MILAALRRSVLLFVATGLAGHLCTAVKVSEVTCTDGGSQCTAHHSNCDITAGVLKCKCKSDYVEDSAGGSTCVMPVSSTVCSKNGNQCKGITNAVCDTTAGKCKCSSGYTMNLNTCAANNAGVSERMTFGTLTIAFVLTVLQTLAKIL